MSASRGVKLYSPTKNARMRTIYLFRGGSPLPKWSKVTASIAQAMEAVTVPAENDDLRPVGPRRLKAIVASDKPFYLREELRPGQPLTLKLLTRRKPRQPKFKVGDRVVMIATTQLDYHGTPLALAPGGLLRVESQYLTETGRVRYVLGCYTTRQNTEPFDTVDRSESRIARLASEDE